jgi:cytochrome c553
LSPTLWRQTLAVAAIAIVYALIGMTTARPQEYARSSATEPWEPCGECHNLDGISANGHFPHLAGQRAAYIEKELLDFQAGARANDHGQMGVASREIGPRERAMVARHFAGLPAPAPRPDDLNPADAERAARLVAAGDHGAKIPACNSCHGVRAKHDFNAPRLEAQQPAYLAKQLADFRSGRRTNDRNRVMQLIAGRLSEADIELVATYLATRQRDAPARLAGRH